MLYSPSTGGFYSREIHGDATPIDAIEISDELYRATAGQNVVPDADGLPSVYVPEPPSVEQRIAGLQSAVQAHLDAPARALGYDDIKTAITYAEEPAVACFQQEARALRAWRSLVWAACYALLERWEAGEVAEPSAEDLIASLPALGLP